MNQHQPNKSFQVRSQVKAMWTIMAILGFVILSTSLATEQHLSGGSTLFGVSLAMCIWSSSSSIVQLFDDHVEMKLGPLAPLRRVLYRDIEKVEILKRKKARLVYRTGGRQTSTKIPLNLLEAQEGRWLLRFLVSKTA